MREYLAPAARGLNSGNFRCAPVRHGRDSSPQRWARSRTLILTQSRLFLQHNFIWCVEPFMSYLYSSLMNIMLCADTARSSVSVLSCCGRKSSPRGRRESRSYSRAPSRTTYTVDSEYCTFSKQFYMVHRTFLERFLLNTDEYNALRRYRDLICRRSQLL